jgi:hypothetical protein
MWIESHSSLKDHPKLFKLTILLKVSQNEAVGILHRLWWWAAEATSEGDLSNTEPDLLKLVTGCRASGERLVDALIQSKFLDPEPLRIHDWYDYIGRLLEAREHTKDRVNLWRDKELTKAIKDRDQSRCRYCGIHVVWGDRKGLTGGTYDHVVPDGGNGPDNIVVACRSCNSKKKKRTPDQAHMPLLPIPVSNDRKVDNQPPDQTRELEKPPENLPYRPTDLTNLTDQPTHEQKERKESGNARAKSPETTRIDDAFRDRMATEYGLKGIAATEVRESIDNALAHKARNKWSNEQRYVQNWLKRDFAASKESQNGNRSHQGSRTQSARGNAPGIRSGTFAKGKRSCLPGPHVGRPADSTAASERDTSGLEGKSPD